MKIVLIDDVRIDESQSMVISEQKTAPFRIHLQYSVCKGQLLSTGVFDVIVWTKIF